MRRTVALALALLALAGCTGTFTPPVPTLYLVFLEGPPARVALLDFVVTPTERRLELLTANAFQFPAGRQLVALDVRDRENRLEAWLLMAAGGAPREVWLHRVDLRGVPDEPGATLTAAAPPLRLTGPDGAWDEAFGGDVSFASTCLSDLVAAASGTALALWDEGAGEGRRCGALDDAAVPDPRVHVVDLAAGLVRTADAEVRAPGVRAADPAEPDALLLTRRPPGASPADVLEVVPVTFDAPSPELGARGMEVAGLLDVRGLPAGFAALRRLDAGTNRELVVVSGETTRERPAVDGATTLHVDASGRLATLVTSGGGRLGVSYPGEDVARSIAFGARDVAIEPLNAYALAVRAAGGLCLVDLLVPSASAGCDLAVPSDLVAALPAPRFVTWAFAEPASP